jgi:NNP family nitrate/nitrite transporter-like MFS transporter
MNIAQFKKSGHWPTLATAFLYFDVSFMVWTMLQTLTGERFFSPR